MGEAEGWGDMRMDACILRVHQGIAAISMAKICSASGILEPKTFFIKVPMK